MATTRDHLNPDTSSQAKMKSIQVSTSALSIARMHTTRDQSTVVSPQTTWLSSSLLASSNTGGLREPQSLIIGASAAVVIVVVIVIASLIIIGAYW